jgi:hypothetical protein
LPVNTGLAKGANVPPPEGNCNVSFEDVVESKVTPPPAVFLIVIGIIVPLNNNPS